MPAKKETKSEVVKDNAYWKEKVKYTFPRIRDKGKNEQPDVIISVNGRTLQIKRGIEVEIPRYMLKAYMESEKAVEDMLDYKEAAIAKLMGKK